MLLVISGEIILSAVDRFGNTVVLRINGLHVLKPFSYYVYAHKLNVVDLGRTQLRLWPRNCMGWMMHGRHYVYPDWLSCSPQLASHFVPGTGTYSLAIPTSTIEDPSQSTFLFECKELSLQRDVLVLAQVTVGPHFVYGYPECLGICKSSI